jgi:baculoviral IAP repeat-containing protein 6
MSELRFGEIESFGSHKFTAPSSVTRGCVRRMASEYSDLSSSLPITYDSSVFLRVCETKMNLCQMLIIPAEHTPYAGGCFIFDIMLPADYPNTVPQCNLQTTGGGSVRFNPNLYNCGKVCLSLLGTWSGDNVWNKNSSLLQLAVSLQSLVFVPEPYFNEPGYEGNMGSSHGTTESANYNRNIRIQTVTHAMIGQMNSPPKGWETVIRTHFKMQKDDILQRIAKWEAQDGNSSTWSGLKTQFETAVDKIKL